MLTRLTLVACILALAAGSALGQASAKAKTTAKPTAKPTATDRAIARATARAKALDQHLITLSTPAGTDCSAFDDKTIPQRLDACQLALAQLAASRSAARGLSAGQIANYDYKQVVLQTALAAAYAQTDKSLSARACALLENSWAIRYRLRSVPRGALSLSAYDTFQQPPAELGEVLGYCRADFPPAPGAPPLPVAPAAT